jgi:fructose/tagatose bisphosphate aldolase
MPLILDYEPTAALYRRCADASLTMARIGYSDQHHLLGIVDGAARFARDHGIDELPLGVFSTVGHYIFQMLPRYLHAGHHLPSDGGDPAAYRQRLLRNARLATGFLATLTDAADPDYGAVQVTHHYDHGHHTLPGGVRSRNELLRDLEFVDLFSSVMFDDTHSPFADNVANSIAYRRFVEDAGRHKVMEGCLEEVAAGGVGLEESASSSPDQIEEYLARTGFELVVPNIGTESVTARHVGVQWQVLEELAARGAGHRLVVHGFSSVRRLAIPEQRRLGELGVVAMNAFSYIPQEIGRRVLQEAAATHTAHDSDGGFPTGFATDGAPQYPDAAGRGDANVFFGPLLDQLRDRQVALIADSVYQILTNLGYARLALAAVKSPGL